MLLIHAPLQIRAIKKPAGHPPRHQKNPDGVICVTGCYAQTSPAEIMAIPGVDIVVGTSDRIKMLDYIEQFKKKDSQSTVSATS